MHNRKLIRGICTRHYQVDQIREEEMVVECNINGIEKYKFLWRSMRGRHHVESVVVYVE